MTVEFNATIKNLEVSSAGYNLIVNLICWPELEPHTVENECINKDEYFYIKGNNGKTTNEKLDDIQPKIIERLQNVINEYNECETIKNSAKVTTLISNVNGGISG
jgi:hypothetical protein